MPSLLPLLVLALSLFTPPLANSLKLVPAHPDSLPSYQPFPGGAHAPILASPADWNRNTFPKPVHSHNDYERQVPVFDALAYGARSIESDVWLNPSDGLLYVGHDPFSLSRKRTFHALTVQPLLKAIQQANSANSRYSHSDDALFFSQLQQSVLTNTSLPWNGYYSLGVGSSAPIQLLVDIKTEAHTTWRALVRELEPIRKRGWLTRYENGKLIPGPILVIGTGNTPVELVAPLHSRDYFIDAPLGALHKPIHINNVQYEWNSTLSPIASGSFSKLVGEYKGLTQASDDVIANISRPIQQAHARGIATRYWDSPQWPVFARDRVNHLMLSAGSDWIGTDDLEAIANF